MRLSTPLRRVAGVAAAAVAAVAVGLTAFSAPARAALPCWERLIADWSGNGAIDGRYSIPCYRAAQQNAPTDLRIYSTLEDDLARGLAARTARHVAAAAPHEALAAASALPAPPSSSSFALLTALLAGLGTLLAVVWAGAMLVRRRR